MNTRKDVANWLKTKMIEWINQEGDIKSSKQFASYLGVSYNLLIRWMNEGGLPGNENVIKLGNRLGPEIYDILGWERPKTN